MIQNLCNDILYSLIVFTDIPTFVNLLCVSTNMKEKLDKQDSYRFLWKYLFHKSSRQKNYKRSVAQYYKMLCKECYRGRGTLHRIFRIRLCIDCKQSMKYKLIYKTSALSKYNVTTNDLKQFRHFIIQNPYNSKKLSYLFFEQDIISNGYNSCRT